MRIIELTEEARTNILENLLKRSPNSYGEFEGRVNEIIENVRANRDAAIFDYTKRFDGAGINAENILVTEDEIKEAYEKVDEKLLTVIRKALVNIRKYHEKQRQYSWFDSEESGIILGQKVTALEKVGVYVPGGKAVYPSSVLMNIVPAKVAGVKTIVMTTPPGKDGKVNPATLVAAKEAGVDAAVQTEALKEVSALMAETKAALDVLVKVTDEAAAKEEGEVQANFYHSDVVPAMEALRAPVDKLEMIVDKEAWPMPSYGDLIFEV